ncbi:MAG: tetratricopeptide repeat protein [candidate division Zixibacteria bacterium]|nr:tetratricopeptide repeat protein [candidate division Zixibacteria bacterium]
MFLSVLPRLASCLLSLYVITGCAPSAVLTSSRQVADDRAPLPETPESPEEESNRLQLQQLYETIKKDPKTPEVHYKAGRVAINLGKWADALKFFQKAIALKPNHADAIFYLSRTLELSAEMYVVGKGFTIMASQRDEAIEGYKKTVQIDPSYTEACYRLALLALIKKDYRLAFGAATELNRLEPNSERSVALTKQVYDPMNQK